jgi:hypothetical protein
MDQLSLERRLRVLGVRSLRRRDVGDVLVVVVHRSL